MSIKVSAYGWPWQIVGGHWGSELDKTEGERFGWNPFKVKGAGRFGGWWAFKLGLTVSSTGRDVILELGIGAIRITKKDKL